MLTENKDAVSCRSGWHCASPTTGCLWIAFHELQRGELRSVGRPLSWMSGHALSLILSLGDRFTDGSVGSSCGRGFEFLLRVSLLSCTQDRRGTYWSVLQVRQETGSSFPLSLASKSC